MATRKQENSPDAGHIGARQRQAGRRRTRRLAMIVSPAALAIALLLAFAPSAFGFFTPESGGSPNANQIDTLYKIVLYIALFVFVVVESALGYALWKFRARRGREPKQIHGNTRLEMAWTGAAVAIVVALAVITFIKLGSILDPVNSDPSGAKLVGQTGVFFASAEKRLPPDHKALEIEIIGKQFVWQYVYPGAINKDGLGAPYTYEQMVVPTHTTVLLKAVSEDVVHSWWIPELGGKVQVVPGVPSYTWFKIDKPGVYRGQCANICGRGHARMIASVRAIPPTQFEAWLARQKRWLAEANAEAAKMRAKLESQKGPATVLNP